MYTYNCTSYSITGYAPHYWFFGRKPNMPIGHMLGVNDDIDNSMGTIDEWVEYHTAFQIADKYQEDREVTCSS